MRPDTFQAAEAIDASLLNGDEFFEPKARKELLEYIECWKKQLAGLDKDETAETAETAGPPKEAVDESQKTIERAFKDVGVTDYVVAVRIGRHDFTMQSGSPFWMIGATTALMRRAAEVYEGSEDVDAS